MALAPQYQKYSYLVRFGQNRHTAEVILEELYLSRSSLTPNKLITLPGVDGGEGQQIPVAEAVSFLREWCDGALLFDAKELGLFNTLYNSPAHSLNLLFAIIGKRSHEKEHLLTSRLQANLELLEQRSALPPATTNKFDPTSAIKNYNQQLLSLDNALNEYQKNLQRFSPAGMVDSRGRQIPENLARDLVRAHYVELEAIRQQALFEYRGIDDNSERMGLVGADLLAGYRGLLRQEHPEYLIQDIANAAPNNPRDFGYYLSAINEKFEEDGGNLEELASAKAIVAQAAPLLVHGRGSLYLEIVKSLSGTGGNMDSTSAQKVADQILRHLTQESGDSISDNSALVKSALQSAGVSASQIGPLTSLLIDSPLINVSVSYEREAARATQNSLGGGIFESLARRAGVDVTFTQKDNNDLQNDYARLTGVQTSADNTTRINALSQRLQLAKQDGGSPRLILELQDALSHEIGNLIATSSEKGWARTIKNAQTVSGWQSKISEKQNSFYKWLADFEYDMPQSRALRWMGERAETIGVWINKRTGLPLYGFFGKVAEEVQKFKHHNSIRVLKSLRGTTTPWGKVAQFSIRHYIKGDLTFSGAWFSGTRELAGRGYKWALAKATSTVIYKSAAAWATKTSAWVATKVLGQAAIKGSAYLATIIAGAASGIGVIASVVGVALAVIDFVVKPFFSLVKKFFSDPGFAAVSLAVGGAFAALGTIPALIGGGITAIIAGLGGALAGLAALFTTALFWAIGIIFFVAILFQSLNMTTRLDPGNPEAIAQALAGTQGSTHISIDKAVTGSFNGDKKISNSNVNQTLTYQVTVTATDIALSDITIQDQATRTTKAGTSEVGDPQNKTVPSLAPGESTTFEYKLTLDTSYRDSYLSNNVVVTATSALGEEQRSYSQNVVIGTPPSLPGGAFAARLASAIAGCYGSKVTIPDGGTCLRALGDPQIALAIPSLVASATPYTYLQCVGFTRAVMVGLGGGLDGRDNAADYLTSPPSGYTLFKGTPMAGDLFVMGYDQVSGTGHIGVVTGVAGTMVMVADANSNGYGGARSNGQIPATKISGYLRRN